MAFDPANAVEPPPADGAQPSGKFNPETAVAPTGRFNPDNAVPVKEDFWTEFGKGSGGFSGLATAPFTDSIPANLIKTGTREAAKEGLPGGATGIAAGVGMALSKKFEEFIHSDDERPITDRMREAFGGFVRSIKDNPGYAIGSFVHGLAADPELFFLPGAGGAAATAKVTEAAGATAGKIAGKAVSVAGAAGIGGGAETARELGADEPLDPGAIGMSAAIAAPAGFLQVRGKAAPKLTPEEVSTIIGDSMKPGQPRPRTEVVPTAGGHTLRMEGQSGEGKTFKTKAEAEEAGRQISAVTSAYDILETKVPRGTRSRLLFENAFTPENMAKWVKRPDKDARMTGKELAAYWSKAAVSAGIGAGIGAWLDKDEPEAGAAFGAAVTLGPRALPRDKRLSIEEPINVRNGRQAVWARHTFQFKSAIDTAVPEPLRRNAISLAMERHIGITLNPEEIKVANAAREFFDTMGRTAVDAGVLKELLHDYVTHIVEDDPNAKKPGLVDGIVDIIIGKSRGGSESGKKFAQQRQYPTFQALQDALRGSGLKIKTADIGEVVAIYSKSMFKAIEDKRLIDALKRTPSMLLPKQAVTRGPSGAPQIGREPIEGSAIDPRRSLTIHAGGGAPPGGSPGEPGGFQLPPDPGPGASRQKFDARQRMLVQPIDQMDSNYEVLPNRQLAGYAVHKDISKQLNFIFSARDPNDVTLGMMALNQASKRAIVSFSLFHAKSLMDAFIGAQGEKAFTRGNPHTQALRALDMFRRGGGNDGIDHLLSGGLILQAPEDIKGVEGLSGAMNRMAALVDQHMPVTAGGNMAKDAMRGISDFNNKIDHFTFGTLQTGFKIITGLDAYERLIKKGIAPEVAGKLAASYTNDIYGSLDWFRVSNEVGSRIGRDVMYGFFNPNGRRWTQILMFAPDWTLSTFRAAYKALPGAVDDPALAALHRRYLAKSALYYLTVANGINLLTAGHSIFENENPTRVQLADGRTLQWSKHSMEPFEWLRDPIQTAANKLAFIPREAIEQMTGKEYVSAHDSAPEIKNRAEHFGRQFLPINAQQGLAGGGAQSALGLLGVPIYGKTAEQRADAKRDKKKEREEKKRKMGEYLRRKNAN